MAARVSREGFVKMFSTSSWKIFLEGINGQAGAGSFSPNSSGPSFLAFVSPAPGAPWGLTSWVVTRPHHCPLFCKICQKRVEGTYTGSYSGWKTMYSFLTRCEDSQSSSQMSWAPRWAQTLLAGLPHLSTKQWAAVIMCLGGKDYYQVLDLEIAQMKLPAVRWWKQKR